MKKVYIETTIPSYLAAKPSRDIFILAHQEVTREWWEDDKDKYDDAAQMKTLIVMQILGNTKTFFDSQAYIQDTNVTEYLNKTIEDQYGILFNMAQENTITEMINGQY